MKENFRAFPIKQTILAISLLLNVVYSLPLSGMEGSQVISDSNKAQDTTSVLRCSSRMKQAAPFSGKNSTVWRTVGTSVIFPER